MFSHLYKFSCLNPIKKTLCRFNNAVLQTGPDILDVKYAFQVSHKDERLSVQNALKLSQSPVFEILTI